MGITETDIIEEPRRRKRESKKMEILGFLFLVVATGALAAGAIRWKDQLTVGTIAVEGNRIVPVEEIITLTRIQEGVKISDVELTAIRTRILHNAFIKDAVISRNYPSQIAVSVTERTPVAFLSTGELLSCDADGVILPHVTTTEVVNLPLISGLQPGVNYEPGTMLADSAALESLSLLLAAEEIDKSLYQMISEVRPSADGDIVFYTSDGGIPVLIGRGRITEKLATLASFWKEVIFPETARRLESVDARYQDQVIVRWADNARTSIQPG